MTTIKAHYIDYPDEYLLVAVVENGKFNQDLKTNAQEHVCVALRNNVIELSKLQSQADIVPLPMQPTAGYINYADLLHNPRVEGKIFQVVAQKVELVINTKAAVFNKQK